jgi:DNA-binding NarL/FixJ family response regulator
VLIVNREALFRDALKRVIDTEDGLSVVAEARDSAEALQHLRQHQPDVALIELSDEDGSLELMKSVVAAGGGSTRVIALTPKGMRTLTIRALEHGAHGVVDHTADTAVLVESVKTVAQGRHWLGDDQVTEVVHGIGDGTPGRDQLAQHYRLTPRELEIVTYITEGYTNKDIAARCRVREDTVKHHLSSIFAKARVRSRLELAMFALRNGFVTADERRDS